MAGISVFHSPLSKAPIRKTVRFAMLFIVLAVLLALLAPVLCNEKPLYARYKGMYLFPALSPNGYVKTIDELTGTEKRAAYSSIDWKNTSFEKVIWCPVVFSPGRSDLEHAVFETPLSMQVVQDNESSPASWKRIHWFGTTKTGADVFSGIVHGARISLSIGIFSMLIAGTIGILLGALAGFFGDHKIVLSKPGLITAIIAGLPLFYFYGILLNPSTSGFVFRLLFALVSGMLLTYMLGKWLAGLMGFRKNSFLHIDQIISRSIEVFNSIPRIVLIITISALSKPSLTNLVLIIGLTSWTEIARLVRAEMLRVRESEYIQSAEVSGIKTPRQVFHHALPNVILPAITAITLGVASAILTESALSFLGIGVPADVVTWGSLLNEGRQNFNAWWLITFPGLAIFLTVLTINLLGGAWSERIDPKSN